MNSTVLLVDEAPPAPPGLPTDACPTGILTLSLELSNDNMIGVMIAIGANAVIPLALNLQKYAHVQNTDQDGKPRKPFMKIPLWWVGITLMISGEFFNLLAYGYAPTALVAPVGAVGVFFNGIITTTWLKEPFTKRDAAGLLAIAAGVILVISSVPEVQLELTSEFIESTVLPDPRCYGYFLFVAVIAPIWSVLVVRRHRSKHVLVLLVLCSLISSVTVVASRAFSSILTNLLATGHVEELASPVPFCALLLIIVTAVWSTAYLNQAMQLFGNNEVVPVYYTTFTLASVSGGALVYREFNCMRDKPALGVLFAAGCFFTFVGVRLVASAHKDERKKSEEPFKRLVENTASSTSAASYCEGVPTSSQRLRANSAQGCGGGDTMMASLSKAGTIQQVAAAIAESRSRSASEGQVELRPADVRGPSRKLPASADAQLQPSPDEAVPSQAESSSVDAAAFRNGASGFEARAASPVDALNTAGLPLPVEGQDVSSI
uniref:Magnesium transporter n=1 Tax=Calcidiscus leptoporus TaxID=127549 RepID=A0A7S0P0L3_9EUKA